jgi:alpha-1,3-mannosyltransferase
MRIVHAVRQYPPGVGGVEATVSSLAERQARDGHQVRVVTLNRIFYSDGRRLAPSEWRNGVEIVRVPYRGSPKYPFAPGVLRHVGNAEIVHVHGVDFFADFLGWLRPLHGKPLILSTHGGFFHTSFARALKRLWFHGITRTTLRNYAFVAASGIADAAIFEQIAGSKVVAVENAVDTAKFAGLATPGARTMIYFGRLAPNKGLDRLIAWFAGLRERDPAWRLIIAGKEMGVSLEQLRSWARAEGIADAIEFHALPSDDDLRRLIARSNVYVCASVFEGFGVAAVEAVGAGLYPLLSDIAPFRRTLARVGCGTAIAFERGRDIDRFLADLAVHEASDAHDAALAPRLAGFGWRGVLDQIEALYARALAKADRRPAPAALPAGAEGR